jgi:hypothetical protein
MNALREWIDGKKDLHNMIPSVLAQHVEKGVKDFLSTTFPVTTSFFNKLDRFLNITSERQQ